MSAYDSRGSLVKCGPSEVFIVDPNLHDLGGHLKAVFTKLELHNEKLQKPFAEVQSWG